MSFGRFRQGEWEVSNVVGQSFMFRGNNETSGVCPDTDLVPMKRFANAVSA